jgi:hypothetical protein
MSLRDELVKLGVNIPEHLGADLDQWAAKLAESPCRNTVALVGLSTVLFYAFEKHHNPKVNDVWDAMVYCSTCLSVGYGELFPKTTLGKYVLSLLLKIGSAMAARTTDGARGSPENPPGR